MFSRVFAGDNGYPTKVLFARLDDSIEQRDEIQNLFDSTRLIATLRKAEDSPYNKNLTNYIMV